MSDCSKYLKSNVGLTFFGASGELLASDEDTKNGSVVGRII